MWQTAKKILPWLVAVGIFAYLFRIYPPAKIWASLHYVNLWSFVPFAVGYFCVVYIADVFSMNRFLKRFGFDVPMRDLIPGRGVTYLIMVLNYGAGQAGFAYYLKKTHNIPIWESLSIFFFTIVIDLFWIVTLAFAGSFFQEFVVAGIEVKKFVWLAAGCAYAGLAFNLFFWRGGLFQKMEKKDWRIIRWINKKDIFRIFKAARLRDYLTLAALRIPIHFTIIVSMYVVFLTFGVYCPFTKILGNIPLIFFIGTIPITPGGLGTTNAVMVELFEPYLKGDVFALGTVTPAELLFAVSLLWMVANYVMKVCCGILCLRRVSKDLFRVEPGAQDQATIVGQNVPV